MRFEFATAGRVVFGGGAVSEAVPAARSSGSRALIVTGKSLDRAAKHLTGLDATWFSVAGEPEIEEIRRGVALACREGCDVIVAFGGGSAIDAGKAIAALLANSGDPLDYLEVIGKGQPLTKPSAPLIAIPTTAGTGSEATRNAVLASREHRVKASLRGAGMLPRLAIVDPQLTHGLPRAITASTGLDALTQLIEPYVSTRANPMVDALCRAGILAARLLPDAYEHDDPEAREQMALASLWSGMALSNAALGAVHGFAAAIGGMFSAPHGAICAALLPHVTEQNIAALREREPDSAALNRYGDVARLLTGDHDAPIDDAAAWIRETCDALAIAPLRAHGITPFDFPQIAAGAAQASSMKGNCIALTDAELIAILERAC